MRAEVTHCPDAALDKHNNMLGTRGKRVDGVIMAAYAVKTHWTARIGGPQVWWQANKWEGDSNREIVIHQLGRQIQASVHGRQQPDFCHVKCSRPRPNILRFAPHRPYTPPALANGHIGRLGSALLGLSAACAPEARGVAASAATGLCCMQRTRQGAGDCRRGPHSCNPDWPP